jgi:hypothetical protein
LSAPRGEAEIVAELRTAHAAAAERLVEAGQCRRELAAELHAAGHPYKWISEQIGVTAQAVEGFIKYQQRRQQRRDARGTTS